MSAPRTVTEEARSRQQVLVCRLRKRTSARAASLPTAGEIELENVSSGSVAIEVRTSPWQYLDLLVTDSADQVVSESFYGDLFSPLEQPYTLHLSPGQKHIGSVSLLGNVPESKLHPGQYKVQAIFQYNGLRAVSEPFSIDLESPSDSVR